MSVFSRMKDKVFSSSESSWDNLSSRSSANTLKYRDVYDDQQLDRSTIRPAQNMLTRWILLGLFVGFVGWFLWHFLVLSNPVSLDKYDRKYEYVRVVEENNVRLFGLKDEDGKASVLDMELYKDPCDVPVPQWYIDKYGMPEMACLAEEGTRHVRTKGLLWWFVFMGVLSVGGFVYARFNLNAQNALRQTSDINQHPGDQHIAVPEELMEMFDFFPDAGAHAPVHVSSMISHVALANKGIKKVDVTRRKEADVFDEDGDVVAYAGEAVVDEVSGEVVSDSLALFDGDFMEELFDVSGVPRNSTDEHFREYFDATTIPYNPGGVNRDKAQFATVADFINETWELPSFETQRPAGAYIVDTAPVNTMVVAMTRAGKGQTLIEPTIDMWTREKQKHNMIINDPKGELLLKFFVPATVRGFHVVQFNLINEMKTDIYNPLGIAAAAARDGDIDTCALTVQNIADVFFPVDGGEDPVWPNAANNAFKRAAYAMIDFYLEEEHEMRKNALVRGDDLALLETEIDQMWSKVTLYNCYQFFVRLASKVMTNPKNVAKKAKDSDEKLASIEGGLSQVSDAAEDQSAFWEGASSLDMLTLYFNATKALPKNSLRTLIGQVDDSLRSMAKAEKMLASVYGIAITAMSFFTEPTIAALTSGAPSQNVDLKSFAFPRCLGVRFVDDFMKSHSYIGSKAIWDAFADSAFDEMLDTSLFHHEDTIKRNGWAYYYFEGIFPEDEAFVRLKVVANTGHVLKTYFFKFVKGYQTSLSGVKYTRNEVTGERIVKGGLLTELICGDDGVWREDSSVFDTQVVVGAGSNDFMSQGPHLETRSIAHIKQFYTRYEEKPKALFLVTPPSRLSYAKIILILIKQLFDVSVEQSYVAKPNQKPLTENRFMLDELGNLQNEGNGIAGLETMLSIGAGQGQSFTLILQTLQQLIAVYGQDVDKIIQGNTSNIVFLKSTDDEMLQTLEKMSGTRHVTRLNQKMVTVNMAAAVMKNDPHVQFTQATEEEPVIKYNDMAFISERNSMVFRAGTPPIWNRNQTILPMSWKMQMNTIKNPGHDYSIQTVPTNSTAMDFDVRTNQPDFEKMFWKRISQAVVAGHATNIYAHTFNLSDHEMALLDPDVRSEAIMDIVAELLKEKEVLASVEEEGYLAIPAELVDIMDHDELNEHIENMGAHERANLVCRFAGEKISRADLCAFWGTESEKPSHFLDAKIISAYKSCRSFFAKDSMFSVQKDMSLWNADGSVCYIEVIRHEDIARRLDSASHDSSSRVFSDDKNTIEDFSVEWRVTDEFIRFLAGRESWDFAQGRFDARMSHLVDTK